MTNHVQLLLNPGEEIAQFGRFMKFIAGRQIRDVNKLKDYSHQFSGGMQQRIMIALALSCTPELIIADEPTTALAVTVQAHILELIAEMRERLGTAVLIITHNLGIVARYVERLNVM